MKMTKAECEAVDNEIKAINDEIDGRVFTRCLNCDNPAVEAAIRTQEALWVLTQRVARLTVRLDSPKATGDTVDEGEEPAEQCEVFVCPDHGPGVKVDEDQCCVTCGRDAHIQLKSELVSEEFEVVKASTGKLVMVDNDTVEVQGESFDGWVVFRMLTKYEPGRTSYYRQLVRNLKRAVGHDKVLLLDRDIEMVRLIPKQNNG